jgi:hypothetical protein
MWLTHRSSTSTWATATPTTATPTAATIPLPQKLEFSQQAPHATTLVVMTTTAVTTTSSMPVHTSLSTMLTTMTTATTTAHPSNFTVVSKSNAHTVTPTMEATINNKSHVNYSVFSLVPTVHLPTITDMGATQHTTN